MDHLILTLGWAGIIAPLALGAMGSVVGSAVAGQAPCGALLEVDSGYGRYIGLSAMPSSQTIYGIVVMFSLNRAVTLETAPGCSAIGAPHRARALHCRRRGRGARIASAIAASKSKPEVFGLSIAPAAIVEGFAVFAFVFALVISGGIPAGG